MKPNQRPAKLTVYNEALSAAVAGWSIRPEQTRLIRDGVNHVYGSVTTKDEPIIIRISDGNHHELHDIEGELLWLEYLIQNDCVVTTPIRSRHGNRVESVETPAGMLHVSCFERFGGVQLDPRSSPEWNGDFLFQLGGILGRVHRLTDDFQLPPDKDRMPWWETELHIFPDPLPADIDREVVEKMQVFLAQLKARATPQRHFGLIHHDIHSGNLLFENGQIQLIDFDLACYGWRLTDFAVLLYSHYFFPAINVPGASPKKAGQALAHLVQGYREEYQLDWSQIEMIPDLLKLRETLCYNVMRPHLDHWQTAMGNPTPTAAHCMTLIERRWLAGQTLKVDLDQVSD